METADDKPRAANAEYHQSRKEMGTDIGDIKADQSHQSFNIVTQQDSHILKNDSKSMKAIATVTMIFLPLATVGVRESLLSFEDVTWR